MDTIYMVEGSWGSEASGTHRWNVRSFGVKEHAEALADYLEGIVEDFARGVIGADEARAMIAEYETDRDPPLDACWSVTPYRVY